MRRKIVGVCAAARPFVLEEMLRAEGGEGRVWLVFCANSREAERLSEDLFVARKIAEPAAALPSVLLLPEIPDPQTEMREAFGMASDRLAVVTRLGQRAENRSDVVIIGTALAAFQPVPARGEAALQEIVFKKGSTLGLEAVKAQLAALDYDHEAICEQPGTYAVRGGIIDIFPAAATMPVRLDFFGDEIEEIRVFDPVTQRTSDAVESVALGASPSLASRARTSTLKAYLPAETSVVLIEPCELDAAYAADATNTDSQTPGFSAPENIPSGLEALLAEQSAAVVTGVFDIEQAHDFFGETASVVARQTESLALHRSHPSAELLAEARLDAEHEARRRFFTLLGEWQKTGHRIVCVVSRAGEEERVRELFVEDGVGELQPVWQRGVLEEGCVIFSERDRQPLVVVTETEIFGHHRQRRVATRRRGKLSPSQVDQLLDFSDLADGDHVVHLQHGIGIYRGLSKIDVGGEQREVLSVEFGDGVTLHVPLQEAHLLSRYVGLNKSRPVLAKIGSGRWEKARAAAERATVDLAAELLAIQARRESQPGHAFGPDTHWQQEFEGSFPFTETVDQMKAIVDAKADMEKTRPMDRLVCGDVGFGKTEVALRAAFKAVMGGRQVAVLVPTTILAQQHFNTFSERMSGYPVVVEMISRFRTRQEQTRILAAVAAGKVDVLIGTHRLLQADVAFKELGLVVVDEEQRFGVKHKEALKRFRAVVDVLSMSATPIPRTLYMALIGARDLSVIETAPVNRLPIQTIVRSYEDKVVVDAIRHEVRRGGQAFYLHNRVSTIEAVANHLRKLLPDLEIGVGHGQMDADDLERVMTEFVAGKFHVLVCTTIIESGLDIPNCNTILIDGADRFGLSQLYQIRGRVGRFRHQAYAYLLLHRHARLMDVARQRLNALRQHNQLGAGFRIAMRDLELRGAGNLLGPEQSGHVAGVGFELYCQLLRQSVSRLKGEKTAAYIRASVKLDFVTVGEGGAAADARGKHQDGYTALKDDELAGTHCPPIQARLAASYISEARLRIDFYRRLALAAELKELKAIGEELVDRFGKYGEETRALLLMTELRLLAEQKKILSVETEGSRLKLLRNSGKRDDYIMQVGRFPRLTARTALKRLLEIRTSLINLKDT